MLNRLNNETSSPPAGARASFLARHALAAYIVLAYAISWIILVPAGLAFRAGALTDDSGPVGLLALVAPFGPVIAAFVVTSIVGGRSAVGTLACVDCWIEDFRKDLKKNTVPTLILHGDADRILPPDATSRRQAKLLKNVKYVELPGGPHGVLWTHADRINSELLAFLK